MLTGKQLRNDGEEVMTEPTKFCVECKFCDVSTKGGLHFCHHPDAFTENPVNGISMMASCAVARQENGTCLPEGLLFEQREPCKQIVDGWLETIMESKEDQS